MPEYRTSEEDRAQLEREVQIRVVLDQAVTDGASLLAAMELAEAPDVVEMWIDRLWDGLRDSLDDEARLEAIVLLLRDRIGAAGRQLLCIPPEETR